MCWPTLHIITNQPRPSLGRRTYGPSQPHLPQGDVSSRAHELLGGKAATRAYRRPAGVITIGHGFTMSSKIDSTLNGALSASSRGGPGCHRNLRHDFASPERKERSRIDRCTRLSEEALRQRPRQLRRTELSCFRNQSRRRMRPLLSRNIPSSPPCCSKSLTRFVPRAKVVAAIVTDYRRIGFGIDWNPQPDRQAIGALELAVEVDAHKPACALIMRRATATFCHGA